MVRRVFIVMTLVFVVIIGIGIAQAATVSGPVVLTCTGIDGSAATGLIDRDNTGTGQESYTISVVDGAGTELYNYSATLLVSATPGPFGSTNYTTPPQYNPITLTLTSHAGNGLPEAITFTAQGTCDGLPWLAACTLNIPEGSVVGEAPLGASVYSSPGEATNITLNPGTYIVVGQDES
ncbi:MAG: hypothetical protein KC547_22735, partial [Anaerolineae bacterium]|nr:hypothetical protein [Anaerolineae bacterium]